MLTPKAALLEPLRRGTLAMCSPTPLDSAVVLFPASGSLPWGWKPWDCCAITALLMTSGLWGVWNTLGSSISSMGSFSPFLTETFKSFRLLRSRELRVNIRNIGGCIRVPRLPHGLPELDKPLGRSHDASPDGDEVA